MDLYIEIWSHWFQHFWRVSQICVLLSKTNSWVAWVFTHCDSLSIDIALCSCFHWSSVSGTWWIHCSISSMNWGSRKHVQINWGTMVGPWNCLVCRPHLSIDSTMSSKKFWGTCVRLQPQCNARLFAWLRRDVSNTVLHLHIYQRFQLQLPQNQLQLLPVGQRRFLPSWHHSWWQSWSRSFARIILRRFWFRKPHHPFASLAWSITRRVKLNTNGFPGNFDWVIPRRKNSARQSPIEWPRQKASTFIHYWLTPLRNSPSRMDLWACMHCGRHLKPSAMLWRWWNLLT